MNNVYITVKTDKQQQQQQYKDVFISDKLNGLVKDNYTNAQSVKHGLKWKGASATPRHAGSCGLI